MALWAVMPTYRRNSGLRVNIDSICAQSSTPDVLLVVDNASSRETEAIVRDAAAGASIRIEYVDSGRNRGPAGAMRIAMELASVECDDEDWLLRLDDDRPLETSGILERLLSATTEIRNTDPMVGGVGLAGARLDYRRAKMYKPPRAVDERWVTVDFLATGFLPIFRMAGVREVGPFMEALFFGWTEVEYGLRMRRAGYNLYRCNQLTNPSPSERTLPPISDWRRFYSTRNEVYVLRSYGHPWAALKAGCLRGIVRPALGIASHPASGLRALKLGVRGAADGWRGNLGMTVNPDDWLGSGELKLT
jgi:GT2 family glycosyltransferase